MNTRCNSWRQAAVVALSVPIFVGVALMSPLAQDLAYHDFADQRVLLGISHFWNVISNLPFAVIGLMGCWQLLRVTNNARSFAELWERNAYFVFFFAEFLTGFGSAYYHANPSNQTLVWDRLIFILLLASFSPIAVTEFVNKELGRRMLIPQVLMSLSSVLYWDQTERAGHGDLRPYALAQFYPALAAPLIFLLFPSIYTHSRALFLAWALFGVAKLCEYFDVGIYRVTGFWSGHTLKHFVAAGATYALLYGLQRRTVSAEASDRRGV